MSRLKAFVPAGLFAGLSIFERLLDMGAALGLFIWLWRWVGWRFWLSLLCGAAFWWLFWWVWIILLLIGEVVIGAAVRPSSPGPTPPQS